MLLAGQAVVLEATAYDADDRPVPDAEIRWSTSDEAVVASTSTAR